MNVAASPKDVSRSHRDNMMVARRLIAIVAVVLIGLFGAMILAQDRGREVQGPGNEERAGHTRFDARDRENVGAWYRSNLQRLPPGFQPQDRLDPVFGLKASNRRSVGIRSQVANRAACMPTCSDGCRPQHAITSMRCSTDTCCFLTIRRGMSRMRFISNLILAVRGRALPSPSRFSSRYCRGGCQCS